MDVYNLAHNLAKTIKNSEEYSEYSKVRNEILKDEKVRDMLQDFQKEQIKLQAKELSGEKVTEEDKERLKNLSKIIELNPKIKKYLEKEYRVNILLNDMQRIIFGDLEIGIISGENKEKHPE